MPRSKRDKYVKSLHQQAYEKFNTMLAIGESKKKAKEDGSYRRKIFSFNTYKAYMRNVDWFLDWVKKNYPDCTTIKRARQYTREWLEHYANTPDSHGEYRSAWTVQTAAKAVGKLYWITPDDPDYYEPPKRERKNIKRSRTTVKRDANFSLTNNDELIKFCRGTGLRRRELTALKPDQLRTKAELQEELKQLELKPANELTEEELKTIKIIKDALAFENEEFFIYVLKAKGGRDRISPIIGKYQGQIIERIRNTPSDKKVWLKVHSAADIHSYRSDYAVAIYKEYAREIADIPYDEVNKGSGKKYQSEVYTCRNDEAGRKMDRKAMVMGTKALGHNRLEIIANNYIRGL